MADVGAQEKKPVPLDEKYYSNITPEDIAFLKSETGIDDDETLKRHILAVQAEAYKVHPYTCIRILSFTQTLISKIPPYDHLLKLGRERKDAIFIDVGCCFGADLRRAVADGYPVENVLGTDLHPEFWKLGYELFNSPHESFPVPFVAGDVLNPSHLQVVPPFYDAVKTPVPDLKSLTSLNPLHGHVSAIHTSSFFHLFTEEQQLAIARGLASLLSPQPGSMIFGFHVGKPEKGILDRARLSYDMFCHCPESWTAMWDEIFEKGTVRVDAKLQEITLDNIAFELGLSPGHSAPKFWVLRWSVTRL
ncbi:hypothetical protein SERLA73DRAFT_118302 [Serpula lacrymans var. lacrymans S7.3]|uniref:Methyltransferase domain-containing protein n=2 Tax=Serpula lacrymans var. lacrymans TaxID=341189 RepID=F8QJ34_SERL3|nr:uncharacterized protein SERLADRAFT_359737 [Serpula lacrymans var. lacrymans S7.9]EGN91680.1 hypothetical protein SERLA73DRAFT_118302 [Serpula lacrymans var. lacrymans S7.3]EGO30027.1 hypothetical protein SERLADRAFT_359737 [Serpula lacrymans var. lacrymans S7.9]